MPAGILIEPETLQTIFSLQKRLQSFDIGPLINLRHSARLDLPIDHAVSRLTALNANQIAEEDLDFYHQVLRHSSNGLKHLGIGVDLIGDMASVERTMFVGLFGAEQSIRLPNLESFSSSAIGLDPTSHTWFTVIPFENLRSLKLELCEGKYIHHNTTLSKVGYLLAGHNEDNALRDRAH